MNTMLAIVCVQQSTEKVPDEDDKKGAPKELGSPVVALAQQGEENKVVGANAAAGAAK